MCAMRRKKRVGAFKFQQHFDEQRTDDDDDEIETDFIFFPLNFIILISLLFIHICYAIFFRSSSKQKNIIIFFLASSHAMTHVVIY